MNFRSYETFTPNDVYENFVNADIETAAAESIPTKYTVLWVIIVVKKKRDDV